MAYKSHFFTKNTFKNSPLSYMPYAALKFAIVDRNELPGNSY